MIQIWCQVSNVFYLNIFFSDSNVITCTTHYAILFQEQLVNLKRAPIVNVDGETQTETI